MYPANCTVHYPDQQMHNIYINNILYTVYTAKGCPNKNARFKVRAIVVLLGWRHWKFNICHLSFLRLLVKDRCTKEQSVIIVKTHYKYGESCTETVRKVSSHAMAIRIGHRGRASWHRATSSFGSLWSFVSMPTKHKQFLSSRRRFDCHWRNWAAVMRKCHQEFRQKIKSVPAASWGTFVGYCVHN
jgi:hypothetical protein